MHARTKGMSLIELCATLGVLATLLAWGLPQLGDWARRERVRAGAGELIAALNLARQQAVLRVGTVVVCPRDGEACAADGDWSRGWHVFLDRDSDRELGARDPRLLVAAREDGLAIRASQQRARIAFLPDGRASGSTVSVSICARDAGPAGAVVILNNAGRVRQERQTCET